MLKTFVIIRESQDEETVAVVEAEVPEFFTRALFRQAVRHAVSEWLETSDIGKKIPDNERNHFNIGDLVHYQEDETLKKLLKEELVDNLFVTVFSETDPRIWDFDESLYIK